MHNITVLDILASSEISGKEGTEGRKFVNLKDSMFCFWVKISVLSLCCSIDGWGKKKSHTHTGLSWDWVECQQNES